MDNLLFQLFTIKYNKTLEDCDEYHEDLLNINVVQYVVLNHKNVPYFYKCIRVINLK